MVIGLNLHRASGAHGEVVTGFDATGTHRCGDMQQFLFGMKSAGSCYLITHFKYSYIYQVFFEISLSFCQEGQQMLCAKFRSTSQDSAQFTERVDIRFAIKYMGVIRQNALSLFIA